jgi:hypothetical protein
MFGNKSNNNLWFKITLNNEAIVLDNFTQVYGMHLFVKIFINSKN